MEHFRPQRKKNSPLIAVYFALLGQTRVTTSLFCLDLEMDILYNTHVGLCGTKRCYTLNHNYKVLLTIKAELDVFKCFFPLWLLYSGLVGHYGLD